jgi:glycosyltransferase involved in cell wall biosynthesis
VALDGVGEIVGEDGWGIDVSLVLPCLDEAGSVGACVTEALDAMRAAGLRGEVVVVDNGSTDGSPELAEAAGARVIHESRRGYGSALRAGFAAAHGEVLVMADADCTYELNRIPELVAPVMADEADLVLGSRLDSATRRTMPLLHRFVGTPVLTFLTARACGRRVVTDSQSGFRAFRKDVLPRMGLTTTGMELASEMLIRSARAGLRISEIQMSYRPRVGESKLSTWSDGWRHLQLIFLLAPDLLLIGPGLVLFVLGVAMLGVAFVDPSGVEVGSLVWQPVFFSGISMVLGMQALLAGAVLANTSSVTVPGVKRRFAFVGAESFPGHCGLAGVVAVVCGILIDVMLFAYWLTDSELPLSELGLTSLAQSLIIIGSTMATFGLVSRFVRARPGEESDATPRGVPDRTPTTAAPRTAPGA